MIINYVLLTFDSKDKNNIVGMNIPQKVERTGFIEDGPVIM